MARCYKVKLSWGRPHAICFGPDPRCEGCHEFWRVWRSFLIRRLNSGATDAAGNVVPGEPPANGFHIC